MSESKDALAFDESGEPLLLDSPFCEKRIKFMNQMHKQQFFEVYLPFIREWKVEELDFQEEKNPQILSLFFPIKLPNLKQLRLLYNRIESVECLFKINLPVLQLLDLGCNRIRSIKNFRKESFPSLSKYNMADNFIIDGQKMMEMCLGKFQIFATQYSDFKSGSTEWIAKFECPHITTLYYENQRSIPNKSLKECLERKYLKVSIAKKV